MYKTGHMGTNILLFSPILFLLLIFNNEFLAFASLAFVVFFASLPDIDIKYSYLPFITHRGITHTIWFGLIIGSITAVIFYIISPTVLYNHNALVIGLYGGFIGFYTIAGHILADSFTPMGIRPFKKPRYIPNSRIFSNKRYSFDFFTAKNPIANSLLLALGVLACGAALYLSQLI